ncbi:tRNA (adenosine(37)-N6)-dimethylallyltransferase [Guggenheimella bovis]
MQKPILALFGPTASGKTALSIELAKRNDMEIVSMDSMQIYRGLHIGNAAPTSEELQSVPHHLVGFQDPLEPFTVADYKRLAREAIQEIDSRGKGVLLVGGTGLYLSSLVYDFSFRKETEEEVELPEDAPFDTKNPRKLERYLKTGVVHQKSERVLSDLPISIFYLDLPRDVLQKRIFTRIRGMIDAGLVEEVRWLYKLVGDSENQALKGIGYKEFIPYIKGECTLEEATEKLFIATRQYAKRQVTWIKHQYPSVTRIDGLLDTKTLVEIIERSFV